MDPCREDMINMSKIFKKKTRSSLDVVTAMIARLQLEKPPRNPNAAPSPATSDEELFAANELILLTLPGLDLFRTMKAISGLKDKSQIEKALGLLTPKQLLDLEAELDFKEFRDTIPVMHRGGSSSKVADNDNNDSGPSKDLVVDALNVMAQTQRKDPTTKSVGPPGVPKVPNVIRGPARRITDFTAVEIIDDYFGTSPKFEH